MFGSVRSLFVMLALAAAAAAVQPLYRVDADVLFLPQSGLALNAHTGAVLWRFPRFDGQTYTDGQGLLLVAWVVVVQPWVSTVKPEFSNNRLFTRVCRLRTSDGEKLWCRDWPDVQQWAVDTGGRFWYLRTTGRLQVISVADGQPDRGFALSEDDDLTLMPLPGHGAMVLARNHDRRDVYAEALTYHPGAAALTDEVLPFAVYPFRGDGRGLLLYAKERGEFFLAAPFTALFHRIRPLKVSDQHFPKASLDDHGFVFTDWQGSTPVLRGGTYDGHLWQAPRPAAEPELALTSTTAVMLESDPKLNSTQLSAWSLDSGQPRFSHAFAGDYATVDSLGNALVLQSASDIRLLDADSGVERWSVSEHEGPLATISKTAVVFWEGGSELAARSRENGNLLWRVHFVLPAIH